MYIAIKNEKIIGIYADNEREGLIDVGIIPSPEEIPGKIPVMYYRNGAIVYEYEPIPEIPEEEVLIPEIPYKEQIVAKIRERYSINDELAILRQRDTKPSEFLTYYQYVEDCKGNVKKNSKLIK